MPLSDTQIRAAKPKQKAYKLSDGGWLYLYVSPTGAKLWRVSYRFGGKEKTLSLGQYPQIGLKDARTARDEAKALLAQNTDPSEQRRADKAQAAVKNVTTFSAVADELVEKKRREGKAETTLRKIRWMLSLATPLIGDRPVADITAPEILVALRKVEDRGHHETAIALRALVGEVCRLAIATGRSVNDPAAALRGALITPKVQHRAAIIDPIPFGGLLRATDDYRGDITTKIALQLLALTFTRPGELRHAEWSEFDLDNAAWAIPAGRMKMRRPHRVPLAPQAVELLRALRKITGHRRLLFPGMRSVERPMSENTLNAALRRMGFGKDEMVAHGFRAAASSILNESGKWSADAIERQLAHVDTDDVRRAYARADFWPERVRMMAWWADKLDSLRRGGDVVALRNAK